MKQKRKSCDKQIWRGRWKKRLTSKNLRLKVNKYIYYLVSLMSCMDYFVFHLNTKHNNEPHLILCNVCIIWNFQCTFLVVFFSHENYAVEFLRTGLYFGMILYLLIAPLYYLSSLIMPITQWTHRSALSLVNRVVTIIDKVKCIQILLAFNRLALRPLCASRTAFVWPIPHSLPLIRTPV